jgi:hypothetical protein
MQKSKDLDRWRRERFMLGYFQRAEARKAAPTVFPLLSGSHHCIFSTPLNNPSDRPRADALISFETDRMPHSLH